MTTYAYKITVIDPLVRERVLNENGAEGWRFLEQLPYNDLGEIRLRMLFEKTIPGTTGPTVRQVFANPALGMGFRPMVPDPSNEDYDTWLRIGQGLWRTWDGHQEGLDIWHAWSGPARNYDAATLDEKWKTFSATGGGRKVPFDLTTLDRIDMIIFCPYCKRQHIDGPDAMMDWENPPHRSHLCAYCSAIFRVADVPTNGVEHIKTKGKDDRRWSRSRYASKPAPTVHIDPQKEGPVGLDTMRPTTTLQYTMGQGKNRVWCFAKAWWTGTQCPACVHECATKGLPDVWGRVPYERWLIESLTRPQVAQMMMRIKAAVGPEPLPTFTTEDGRVWNILRVQAAILELPPEHNLATCGHGWGWGQSCEFCGRTIAKKSPKSD